MAPALADLGCEVTAPDLRGHGSAPAAVSFRLDDFAADLRLLGAGWDVVVGHSLGGPIVATLLKDSVEACGVVMVDPVFEISEAEFDSVLAEQLAEVDFHADPRLIAEANPRWHPEDAFHKAQAARVVSPVVVERALVDNRPWAHARLLFEMDVPCTVLGSDPDEGAMFSPELGQRAEGFGRHMTYVMAQGTGHCIHREEPELLIEAVAAFL